MTRFLARDRIAIAAALVAPLAAAAILLPFRASWSNTNVALLLVVVVVEVAAIGSRVAGPVRQITRRGRRSREGAAHRPARPGRMPL